MSYESLERLFQRIHIPYVHRLERGVAAFTFSEKVVFTFLCVLLAGSTLWLVLAVNNAFSINIPAHGGSIVEGVVGAPRFINPLLALSDADRDVTALVYSGLMKATPEGMLIPDLAEAYDVSTDGLVYTFHLRPRITFHDGTPITADDILFTVKMAQDSTLKSPKRANWDGVAAEKIDERTVRFTLKVPYAPFLENTTLGILPAHIWSTISSDQFAFSTYNNEPIGSGPFRFQSFARDTAGIPTQYTLKSFAHYARGEAHCATIVLRFYANEDALVSAYHHGDVENINSITPETARRLKEQGATITTYPLPRVFGVFFNQNQAKVLTHKEVRAALDRALDKQKIVDGVLAGFGTPTDSPLPPGLAPHRETRDTGTASPLEEARTLLERNGWTRNKGTGIYEKKISKKETQRLSFSITTSNAPELKRAGEMVAETWRTLGADVTLHLFDIGTLNQEVIRPRKYDALLFGQVIGRDLDLFAFWHSSQRNDPGLNIALYANIIADSALEKNRTTIDPEKRNGYLATFTDAVIQDVPAVFLYAPDFISIVSPALHGVTPGTVTTGAERFLDVHHWYVRTERVWSIFAPTSTTPF